MQLPRDREDGLPMRLQNKVALIVGGASDIGCATGIKFLREGASVVLADLNPDALDATTQRLSAQTGLDKQLHTIVADVTVPQQMDQAVAQTLARFGRLDILVNCAGIIRHSPIDEMRYEDWADVLQINLTGTFNACKAAVTVMKQQRYGRIVNISSLGGRTGRPGVGVNYAASKAGVVGLTQLLAKELAPAQITVNAVAPGPLKGKLFDSMAPHLQESLQAGIPLGRVGEMDEVASAILYLSSDEASWVTGEILDINGGVYI